MARPTFWSATSLADPIELVIFDCDGVLVDSEMISFSVLRDAIADRGLSLTIEEVQQRFQGRSLTAVVLDLAADGIEFGPIHQNRMNEELLARFERELRPISGMSALVQRLTVPCCVASSSRTERLRRSLAMTELLPLFGNHVFSADSVKHGKPAPDLFLYAAERMSIMPVRCLVIEDSAPGMLAAKAAGMDAIGFAGGRHLELALARASLYEISVEVAASASELEQMLRDRNVLR